MAVKGKQRRRNLSLKKTTERLEKFYRRRRRRRRWLRRTAGRESQECNVISKDKVTAFVPGCRIVHSLERNNNVQLIKHFMHNHSTATNINVSIQIRKFSWPNCWWCRDNCKSNVDLSFSSREYHWISRIMRHIHLQTKLCNETLNDKLVGYIHFLVWGN